MIWPTMSNRSKNAFPLSVVWPKINPPKNLRLDACAGSKNVTEEKKHTFPLLNTEEAEEIVSELGSALDAHRDWTEKFRTMLVCRTKPKAIYLNADSHKKTVSGRGYSGKVNPLLRNLPEFPGIPAAENS